MKRLAILLLFMSAQASALGFADFDPFNEDGQLRKGLATLDPFVRNLTKTVKSTKEGAMVMIANEVSEYPYIKKKVQEEGWTNASCRTSGIAIVTLISAIKGAEICAALLKEPASISVCTAFIATSGIAITEIMCRTLCHRHELKDCPVTEENP